jgi:hypothetical protein
MILLKLEVLAKHFTGSGLNECEQQGLHYCYDGTRLLGSAAAMGPLPNHHMIHDGGIILTGGRVQGRNQSQCHFVHKSHMGANPGSQR